VLDSLQPLELLLLEDMTENLNVSGKYCQANIAFETMDTVIQTAI
jgi:hypothetical protein